MKIRKAYSNKELIAALQDRNETYNSCFQFDLDDEQIEKLNRYNNLSQFEKDVLYLYSQYNVTEVARLYGCSKQLIYSRLKEIKDKL